MTTQLHKFYEKLNNGYIIVTANHDIDTDRDIALAHAIYRHGNLIYWQNYGSSAEKNTLKDLKWLLENIFNNDTHYMILTKGEYYTACNNYYEEERRQHNV